MSLVLVPAGCERPSSIRDGFFTVRKRTTREGTEYAYPVNSSIEYHCSPGYHLNGPDVLTCSGQRGWVPWTLPSCSPIDTGDQEEHSSGERQWFYIRLGSSVLMWFDVKKKDKWNWCGSSVVWASAAGSRMKKLANFFFAFWKTTFHFFSRYRS